MPAIENKKSEVNEQAIRYQARTTLADLANEICSIRNLEKDTTIALIKRAAKIRYWLKALDAKEFLTREQREQIWYKLIEISQIYNFPTAPILELRNRPSILTGLPGAKGDTGAAGGGTGGIPFSRSAVNTGVTVVDLFPITIGSGTEWLYTVKNGTDQRTGHIEATWLANGSAVEFGDDNTTTEIGDTSDVQLSVDYSAGEIRLLATALSDGWTVEGTRSGIPVIVSSGGGSGGVTGPASSVTDDFASFLDTSGQVLKDSGYNAASFLKQGPNTLTQNLDFDGAFHVGFGYATTPITTFRVNTGGMTLTSGYFDLFAGQFNFNGSSGLHNFIVGTSPGASGEPGLQVGYGTGGPNTSQIFLSANGPTPSTDGAQISIYGVINPFIQMTVGVGTRANFYSDAIDFDGAIDVGFGQNTPITTFNIANDEGLFVKMGHLGDGNAMELGAASAHLDFNIGSFGNETAILSGDGIAVLSSINGNQVSVGDISPAGTGSPRGVKIITNSILRMTITEAGAFRFLPSVAPVVGQVITATNVDGTWTWQTPSGGGGTVTSVSGTTNRITSTGGATPVIDISASYVGQTSITTLGTITTGTWTGTAITAANGGTGITSYAVGDILYASGATTLSKLADVAAGSYLRSGGVTTAPAWSTVTLPNTVATGDIWQASATNTVVVLPSVATGNVLISGGVTTVSAWGKVTSAHVDATVLTTTTGWQVAGTSTFTGAVLIDQTTTAGNTLKFKSANLGVTPVDGKGIWLYNDTAAAAGAQQISGSIVQEGQGWATTPVASQSVKFRADVLPVQGAANPSATWRLFSSINAGAYVTQVTVTSGGVMTLGTPGSGLGQLATNNILLSGTGSASLQLLLNSSSVAFMAVATGGTIMSVNSQTATIILSLAGNSGSNWMANTSGNLTQFNASVEFRPTSGTATVNYINSSAVINMTGGANGLQTIFRSAPTITAAVDLIGFLHDPVTPANISGVHLAFKATSGSGLIGGTTLTTNAILDLQSTTKAFIPPRMTTTQRDAIGSPSAGMVIHNTTTGKLNVYTTAWEAVTSA